MDSISKIEVLIKTVDLGGFTRAAENLGLTPSGVSRLISRLEGRLGVRLLNRTTRSLSLTDEGAVYHEHAVPKVRVVLDFVMELFASRAPADHGMQSPLNQRTRRNPVSGPGLLPEGDRGPEPGLYLVRFSREARRLAVFPSTTLMMRFRFGWPNGATARKRS
ncbi:LysR family transcriptional regulator [Corallococcus coralloides]|nr:LysR family transcriptional regulator [Corallococcus coralloides]